ncbi:hypothetical protein EX895_003425 [Sporisorium graminicola]|uniref:Cyanovirin-N domain-containing protein n=1 Tax=Sporisorium graminicola TaxID=280036 RepID=A0A4U7KTG3_9BASI|nr:hypothetical protein EX895_003425 [Sporisorium graminicola]TKY87844.1 hypothetical protein EX895_003425 [Sporisorium graminicola]
MKTRTTQPLFSLPSLSFLLLIALLSTFLSLTPVTSAAGVDPASLASQPYQYFRSDGVGGSSAACWLSRVPFPAIDGISCRFADTISQVKGRQIWQCDGDQGKFCDGCHQLEAKLTDPKDLVAWKVQGC